MASVADAAADAGVGECSWRIPPGVCAARDLLDRSGVAVVEAEGRPVRRCLAEEPGWPPGPRSDSDRHGECSGDTGDSLRSSVARSYLPLSFESLSDGSH